MTRTFIALELNEELQSFFGDTLSRASQAMPELRWVDPEGIHLTLAFLGELSNEQLIVATQASEKAAQKASPFDYRLKGLGIFGSPHNPQVIWMGIEDIPSGSIAGSPLQQLHSVLSKELEFGGFELEKRPFSPHLTLARNKRSLGAEEQQRLQRLLHAMQAVSSSPLYRVNHLCVMKSELSRTGAKYTCLRKCSFSQSSPFM